MPSTTYRLPETLETHLFYSSVYVLGCSATNLFLSAKH